MGTTRLAGWASGLANLLMTGTGCTAARGASRGRWFAALAAAVLVAGCGGGSGRQAQSADLAVSAVGPTAPVAGGATTSFVTTVTNAGPDTASDVRVSNVLSNQVVPTGVTCTASGGAVCPDAPTPFPTVASLPAGGMLVFTLNVQLTPQANGSISNTASVSSEAGDANRANNSATATATASTALSNLVVSGAGPAGTVTGGGSADFTFSVRNDGPQAASNVQLLNNAGTGLVVRSGGVGCAASGGATCPATLGASMTLASLPAGGVLDFVVATTVSPGVNADLPNTFSASADNETSRSDNSFTAQARVVTPRTGVFATGVGPGGTVAGGGTASFVMTVGNAGPDPAPQVSIVNSTGSNLVFTGITCAASGGGVCPSTLGPVMTAANLPAGAQLVFTVGTQVAAGTTGTLTNTLTVSADNDTERGDNVATATATAATPRAAFALSGTAPAATVAGGETATFVMTVTNTGPDAATGVRVVNTVGGNLTFTGATCAATAPAVCPAAVGVVTTVGDLPAGGQLRFNVNAVVAAGTNGAITNTLQAFADNAFSPAGNSVVAVGQAATARSALAITPTGPQNVAAGTAASFGFRLRNTGPDVAGSVTLVNDPNGLVLTEVLCSPRTGGAACPAQLGATMTLANLPLDGELDFTFKANVPPGTQGSILSTLNATVTSGTRSQTSAVAVGSAYSNNLVASGAPPAGPLAGGQTGVFTMTLANNGPGPALNAQADITLGTGLVPGGAIGCTATAGAACPATPAASMAIPSLPSGGSLVFTVPATVVAGTNANVGVTLNASALGDSRPGDNTATAAVAAVSPDLAVSQGSAASAVAGNTLVFTATVANPASSAATNLTLTSALSSPNGVPLAGAGIVCTPATGATCPASLGPAMSLASLPPRGSLTFTITLPTGATTRGTVTHAFSVTAAGDPNPGNNSASNSTQVVDPRNGDYKLFAANGRAYEMSIDFDAGRYSIVGEGVRSFSADAGDANGFTVAASTTERLRVASDVVVGAHAFAERGLQPYVAVRTFASSVAELAGSYNQVSRDFSGAGASALTRAGIVSVVGNQMSVCETDDASIKPPGSACPANRQRNFLLSAAAGGGFLADEIGGANEDFTFQLARSGASKFIVAAPANAAATPRLRIALQDTPSLLGGTVAGASTSGAWIPSAALTASSITLTGGSADAGSFTLSAVPGTGVNSMKQGNRAAVGVAEWYWVMQSAPLVVGFGDFTAQAGTGTAGLLQILLP